MKITALVGVKDEVELIDACVRHLRSIGVGQIIVFDVGSTDGTIERLQEHAGLPDLKYFVIDDRQADAMQRANQIYREVLGGSDADWVIFLDADEFWIPATGDLRVCAERAQADVLSVRRFNVPVTASGALLPDALQPSRYGELQLFVKKVPNLRARLKDEEDSMAWIRGVPRPKAMARRRMIAGVAQGGHDVITPPNVDASRCCPLDLLIAHVPFTTSMRFARKLGNIGEYFRQRDAEGKGEEARAWHWRRWNELSDEAAMQAEFDQQLFSDRRIGKLRERGVIRSAAEMLLVR
ncbi:glycosyltransferase family 2 protein [Hydrocarboniphaga sp.]|uniref:glycosyltransferase family 2 protein n=1 Tax=Hydrocarboniphaga sp. TaxID=2033016 RepID=UPI002612011C|nr:glycosyltransferase family 2 protein [Hydrocarboniphaga sp.]